MDTKLSKTPNQVIRTGRCVCHWEPQGRCGMEGYNRGEEYTFEEVNGVFKHIRYMRVYHNDTHDGYYETCGPQEFTRFFKEVNK